ncbi:regulator of telomere elongation helicase 1 [Dorcoceras hygrometricum]|uniref:Regulator of telomere elongation helicase 1 n=1 Tax=Dorcoceras hygrometricum TaxID=472368 RepID=A0A2Z7AXC8_9LAMI|nr:regulator of telomere elongation helicase 1 [Dorcoceras hygrometricum]
MFKRITLLALVPGSNRYYKNPALLGRLRIRAIALISMLGNRGGSGSCLSARQRKNKIRPENVQYNSFLGPTLEGLTRSARTDSPRKTDRSKSNQFAAAAAAVEAGGDGGFWERREACGSSRVLGSRTPQNPPQVLNALSLVSVQEYRIQYLCDPQWFRDTASRGPTTIVSPESQFRTCPPDHVGWLGIYSNMDDEWEEEPEEDLEEEGLEDIPIGKGETEEATVTMEVKDPQTQEVVLAEKT